MTAYCMLWIAENGGDIFFLLQSVVAGSCTDSLKDEELAARIGTVAGEEGKEKVMGGDHVKNIYM